MSGDKFKIDIGKDGLGIEVAGNAGERWANQLADLISPLTELAGLAGQEVRIWKIQRAITAIEQFNKRVSASDQQTASLDPKVLCQWLEKAAIESDDNLSKKWGNLLYSSGGEYSTGYVWASNILSELTASEAEFLDRLYSIYKPYLDKEEMRKLSMYEFGASQFSEDPFIKACNEEIRKMFTASARKVSNAAANGGVPSKLLEQIAEDVRSSDFQRNNWYGALSQLVMMINNSRRPICTFGDLEPFSYDLLLTKNLILQQEIGVLGGHETLVSKTNLHVGHNLFHKLGLEFMQMVSE